MFLATILPPCFFALAAIMLFGLARGTAGQLAGDGGFSLADLALIALLVIASATVFGQGLGLLRRAGWGRKVHFPMGGLRFARQRNARTPTPALSTPPPLLDLASEEQLLALAPPGVGLGVGRINATFQTARRTGDTALWIVLGTISVAVAGFAALGAGLAVWGALRGGAYTFALLFLAVLCGMAFLGLAMMARTTVIAIFDRKRRRRRPAFLRVGRSGAKPMSEGDNQGGGRPPATAVVTSAAAATLLAASFWPELSDAFGAIRSDTEAHAAAPTQTPPPTPGKAAASVSNTAAPGTAGAAGTTTPSVAAPLPSSQQGPPPSITGIAGGTTPAPSASAGPSAAGGGTTPTLAAIPTPAGTPQAPATGVASPSTPPTAAPTATPNPPATATPPRTPATVPVPAATPTPIIVPPPPTPAPTFVVPTGTATAPSTATPSPPPPVDTDGDTVPDAIEQLYGSNPNDAASTPESTAYDAVFTANTCSDGLNNDKDSGVDSAGGMGLGPDVGCTA